MNDDELEAFLERAFNDWWYTNLGYKYVSKHEYLAIAKHFMEYVTRNGGEDE